MKIKYISMAVSLAAALSLLTGCGGGSHSGSDGPDGPDGPDITRGLIFEVTGDLEHCFSNDDHPQAYIGYDDGQTPPQYNGGGHCGIIWSGNYQPCHVWLELTSAVPDKTLIYNRYTQSISSKRHHCHATFSQNSETLIPNNERVTVQVKLFISRPTTSKIKLKASNQDTHAAHSDENVSATLTALPTGLSATPTHSNKAPIVSQLIKGETAKSVAVPHAGRYGLSVTPAVDAEDNLAVFPAHVDTKDVKKPVTIIYKPTINRLVGELDRSAAIDYSQAMLTNGYNVIELDNANAASQTDKSMQKISQQIDLIENYNATKRPVTILLRIDVVSSTTAKELMSYRHATAINGFVLRLTANDTAYNNQVSQLITQLRQQDPNGTIAVRLSDTKNAAASVEMVKQLNQALFPTQSKVGSKSTSLSGWFEAPMAQQGQASYELDLLRAHVANNNIVAIASVKNKLDRSTLADYSQLGGMKGLSIAPAAITSKNDPLLKQKVFVTVQK